MYFPSSSFNVPPYDSQIETNETQTKAFTSSYGAARFAATGRYGNAAGFALSGVGSATSITNHCNNFGGGISMQSQQYKS